VPYILCPDFNCNKNIKYLYHKKYNKKKIKMAELRTENSLKGFIISAERRR
jgi:hypothetical protein